MEFLIVTPRPFFTVGIRRRYVAMASKIALQAFDSSSTNRHYNRSFPRPRPRRALSAPWSHTSRKSGAFERN
jgi:hypothetical protein